MPTPTSPKTKTITPVLWIMSTLNLFLPIGAHYRGKGLEKAGEVKVTSTVSIRFIILVFGELKVGTTRDVHVNFGDD